MKKRILDKHRIRSIDGGFAFIPHRFLTDGFWASHNSSELLLYLFLTLAADAYGLSFYGDRSICRLLKMSLPVFKSARQALIDSNLIAFEAPLYQVLELPPAPKQISDEPVNPIQSSPCDSASASSFSDLRRLTGE